MPATAGAAGAARRVRSEEAAPGTRRNRLKAARAWLRTPRFHPLSLIEPNLGVFGVHLLHLGSKEYLVPPALEEIYRAVDAGELRPIIDLVLPLDRDGAVAANAHLHARRVTGKVVLATPEEENPRSAASEKYSVRYPDGLSARPAPLGSGTPNEP